MKKKILAALLAVATTLQLAGCGVSLSGSSAPQADSASAASSSASSESADAPYTLRVVDWSDSTKARREVYNQQFMADHPNVTVEYTCLTADQFKETVLSSIKGGEAPDLFPVPSGMKLSAVVNEGWYMPMNDYVSQEFLDAFAQGALNEGITTLDGKVYALPESANIINTLMFYNKTVLKEAGVTELPKTWSDFISVCNKVTAAGNGKYYGIIDSGAQTNRLELFIRSLASLEGGKTSDIGQIVMTDGQNPMNTQAMQDAFAFYDTLVKDGSFHPDSTTLKAPEARALFAQNQAAFLVQGAWCISTWRKDNPDLDFGVMALPVPDAGQTGKLPYVGAQPWMGISSTCKNPAVAAEYLKGLYSTEYQSGLVEDGGFVSVIEEVNKSAMTDPVMLDYYTLNGEQAALAPDPIVANAEAAAVYAQVTAVSPSLGEIVQGVLSQSVDYKAELSKLSDATQTEWERALQAAVNGGAKVSKADFEFKNWNPMQNYTAELYAAR